MLNFAWKVPTEAFVILDGSKLARWGDEAEAGAGLRFSGRLDGFVYGSLREMAGVRYWGIGIGAIL